MNQTTPWPRWGHSPFFKIPRARIAEPRHATKSSSSSSFTAVYQVRNFAGDDANIVEVLR